jgi:phosphoserine phosphatase
MQSARRPQRARVAIGSHFGYGGAMKLERGNWSERNFKALNEMLRGVRRGEIAVFDWDIGEALLRRLTFDATFRLDARSMAATVPDTINGIGTLRLNGRPYSLKKMKEAVFAAYGNLRSRHSAVVHGRSDDDYRVFTSGLLALNRALEETPGIGCEFAYPWVNTLLQGLTPAELDEIAAGVIAGELRQPLRRRAVQDPQRRWRYDWMDGIRLYPEMRDLAACWQERGGRVVVSTASFRKLVERMIALTAFPCRQVIGMELALAGGRFGRGLQPGLRPNLGKGKVANIRNRLAREPVLAVGDSSNDFEMLTAFPATRLRLVIDRHAPGRIRDLVRRAREDEEGWLAQRIDRRHGTFKAASVRS